jgi:formylglycine-generating enzyme required for sulfatase activity
MKTAVVTMMLCLSCGAVQAQERLAFKEVELNAVSMAIKDLKSTYPGTYDTEGAFSDGIDRIVKMPLGQTRDAALERLQRQALLSNPLLGFGRLLLVRRKSQGEEGFPANWQGNERLKRTGYTNDIAMLSLEDPKNELRTVYRPSGGQFVGDLDLHFDGRRLLFSMPGKNGRWQVHELTIDPDRMARDADRAPAELALIPDNDVDNYDACYLPDGNVLFTSTATFTGVPCVQGDSYVANIYRLDVTTGTIRRLTFDQDHNWNPTVLNNGRVMYLRWEYSDLPHFVARILFHMNPDGTNQSEYYGSGSYWPNSFFYPRAIPDHPTQVVGIVTGHHGVKRAGELVILDPALGRHEADGVVQRIPGYGKKVEPLIVDQLVDESWPKFLHPYPLSSKYFLVSAKLTQAAPWSLYLVDIFDNMLLLKTEAGFDLLEPTPIKKNKVPPAIPSQVDTTRKYATVYMEDIYKGPGLAGVPRGTVKTLRLITYHFSYRNMGGQQDPIGVDGPWDVKCVLGTVPVHADGSAIFEVPANLPIAFQPLDEEGKAIQLMRSWNTAMPGETVSCVGCHEKQSGAPVVTQTIASRMTPSQITPWYGEVRGFSFKREIEPLVDKYCAECHGNPDTAEKKSAAPAIVDAYMFLRRLIRTPTMEPDMHVCEPYEFHADTTELVRMLQTGHHDVKLDPEAWDRLITWIDLNTPFHGSWTENVGRERMRNLVERRRDLMRRYAGINGILEDPDALVSEKPPEQQAEQMDAAEDRPWVAEDPVKFVTLDTRTVRPSTRLIEVAEGVELGLVRIDAGEFLKGEHLVRINEPFWMATHETSNKLYALFDADHDSRLEPGDYLHFDPVKRGYPLNEPDQPVVKVSWERAVQFCEWLGHRTGLTVALPNENQWEWACRAGSNGTFWYDNADQGFTQYDNLADAQLTNNTRYEGKRWQWRPGIMTQDDGYRVSSPVGSYEPNPWGLYDIHGNVAEWTSSIYESGSGTMPTLRVVRGGSWADRPKWAGAGVRWGYREFQKVYNVGFRIIVTDEQKKYTIDK